jgi:hypothetical protein
MDAKVIVPAIVVAIVNISAQTVAISGKVTTNNGKGISGAVVTLASTKLSVTTDASGAYSLSGALAVNHALILPGSEAISLNNGSVAVRLVQQAPLRIELFDVQGNLLKRAVDRVASAGTYRFDLMKPQLSRNMMVIRVGIGQQIHGFRYFPLTGGKCAITTPVASSTGRQLVKLQAIQDTLIAAATRYTTKRVAITSYQGTVDIALDTADTEITIPGNVILSEGFEGDLSSYRQITYMTGQGLMSITTQQAHSGKGSLTSDSNNTGIKRMIDPSIDDSIAGLLFYLMAAKASQTNFLVAICKPGSSANGLFTIMGMGIDMSDSLRCVYEDAPADPSNKYKNIAPLSLNTWYKCKIEYGYSAATLTYFLNDAVVYAIAAPSPMTLHTFVVMRDSLGAAGPSEYYIDDVAIYKR